MKTTQLINFIKKVDKQMPFRKMGNYRKYSDVRHCVRYHAYMNRGRIGVVKLSMLIDSNNQASLYDSIKRHDELLAEKEFKELSERVDEMLKKCLI